MLERKKEGEEEEEEKKKEREKITRGKTSIGRRRRRSFDDFLRSMDGILIAVIPRNDVVSSSLYNDADKNTNYVRARIISSLGRLQPSGHGWKEVDLPW